MEITSSYLYHADCLAVMDYLISQGRKFQAIIADIPYGTTQCKWDTVIPLEAMWKRISQLREKKTAVVLFGTNPFLATLVTSNIKNHKYDWTWAKNKSTNHLNAKRQPLRNVEHISVFYKHNYYPVMSEGHKPVNSFTHNVGFNVYGKTKIGFSGGGSTKRYPKQTLYFDVVNNDGSSDGGRVHPTQKPVALMEYLVKTYTREGDSVLDFTMGSGSSGVACHNLNRNFVGVDNDIASINAAIKRIPTGKVQYTL